MALVFRTFKAASSGARFTTRAKTAVKRALEQIPSPSLDGLRTALRAARGVTTTDGDRAARFTANSTPTSNIAPAPNYAPTQLAPTAPDMTAAIRAARTKKRK